ncbi:MAG TPA: hydrogenase 3 maturation endopeptidase HyCI, partial [Anaerolineaceae bacterium]|nr:hydrogenase 3 maturation endopeptidase HyCI [Anaerolineaceae bacterium]
ALSAERSNLPKTDARQPRLAVVGLGSELLGDDALGLVCARRLAKKTVHRPDFLVVEAGPVPENALGPLRRFEPDLVVIVDAADLALRPGSIRLVEADQLEGFSASTHTFPLSFIMDFFSHELGCPVKLLAIQPAQFEFTALLSIPVRDAVGRVVRYFGK